MSFAEARDNFVKASKFGLDTKLNWLDDKKIPAAELILDHLLPIAQTGLEKQNISSKDIEKYLGIIEQRAKKQMTGARWQLRSFTKLKQQTTKDEALVVLTSSIIKNQASDKPIHLWPEAEIEENNNYDLSNIKVSEFMKTDFFALYEEDIIELVAQIIKWKKLQFVPIEDKTGKLKGCITKDQILDYYTQSDDYKKGKVTIADIMDNSPLCINPNESVKQAISLMHENKQSFIHVVKDHELLGIITKDELQWFTSKLASKL